MSEKKFCKNMDLKKLALPNDIILKKDCVTITEGVKNINSANVFYREALPLPDTTPTSVTVLLLHGKMFSSKTWLDLGTIHILAAMGFRTVAIDIPGYANTPPVAITDKAVFLHHVIHEFDLKHPVIVSPSMSGYFTLPYLLKHWKTMAGYIPVAPVGFEVLEQLPPCRYPDIKEYIQFEDFLYDPLPDLSHIQTPTMIVFGEKDRSFHRSSALLSLLPVSQCQEIPNGGHPAYLDNPSLWHQLLYNFLTALEHTYSLEV